MSWLVFVFYMLGAFLVAPFAALFSWIKGLF